MLCYSCESPKENSDCQINPNQTTTTMCESKQQICYTKKSTNVAGRKNVNCLFAIFYKYSNIGKLLQFSRGCSMSPQSTSNITQQSQCLSSKAEGKTICVKYCQTSLCNIQDIRFFTSSKSKLNILYLLLAMAHWQ